jgi:hypothetical protein
MEVELPLEPFELLLVGSVKVGIKEAARRGETVHAAPDWNVLAAAVPSKKKAARRPALCRFDAFGPSDLSGIHLSEERHEKSVSKW